MLKCLLAPAALLYKAGVTFRHRLFDWGILKSEKFDIPVICIGNITVGGTGKTPMAEMVIAYMSQMHRVALLSRGYGRRTKGYLEVKADSRYRDVGDEPLLIKLKFPDTVVAVCEKRADGIRRICAEHPDVDLIVMDVMMPGLSGSEACMQIREFSDVPIIMLTARSEDSDKLMGFACGADDYVTKPFNILELKARIRALLRRSGGLENQNNRITAGSLTVDTQERNVYKDGKPVELTAREFDLVELLIRNPNRVYSRENLLDLIWGYEYRSDIRTVDVHIRRIREKLETVPAEPEYIMTKWGVGYYFKA